MAELNVLSFSLGVMRVDSIRNNLIHGEKDAQDGATRREAKRRT